MPSAATCVEVVGPSGVTGQLELVEIAIADAVDRALDAAPELQRRPRCAFDARLHHAPSSSRRGSPTILE